MVKVSFIFPRQDRKWDFSQVRTEKKGERIKITEPGMSSKPNRRVAGLKYKESKAKMSQNGCK